MKRTLVERFFADFGHATPIEGASRLFRPLPGASVYTAERERVAGRVARGLFFIRMRDAAEKLASVRADTVVLGATSLKAIDFWRPVSKGRKKPADNWVADIVEVPYSEIVALRVRRSGLTHADVLATKYW
ncbi:MAG: hypothetical protein O3C69_05910 [Chloroflexi bacterium]|nr:hypothetical protein [Chloroflexota bacterium]